MTRKELKSVIGEAADKALNDYQSGRFPYLNKEISICAMLLGYIHDAL